MIIYRRVTRNMYRSDLFEYRINLPWFFRSEWTKCYVEDCLIESVKALKAREEKRMADLEKQRADDHIKSLAKKVFEEQKKKK